MPNDEFHPVTITRLDHRPGLTHANRHTFFAQDALRGVSRCRQNRQRRVRLLRRRDADEVRLLFFQHSFEIRIPGLDVILVRDEIKLPLVEIAERNELRSIRIHVTICMVPTNLAT